MEKTPTFRVLKHEDEDGSQNVGALSIQPPETAGSQEEFMKTDYFDIYLWEQFLYKERGKKPESL